MELNDFVKKTIENIAKGIVEGHESIAKSYPGSAVSDSKYKIIHFDVAVTSVREGLTGDSFKVNVLDVIKIGDKETFKQAETSLSRISFDVYLNVKADNTPVSGGW